MQECVGSNVDDERMCGAEGLVGMTPDIRSAKQLSAAEHQIATDDPGGMVTIILFRNETTVSRLPGETLLNCARRVGLSPPYSCEQGECGTCMAKLVEGSATMQVNEALMDDEVAEGYVLTCQAVPDVAVVKVSYDE
ncbi:2Fe-2S iron-sulfur cluster-binding protein [Mycobacterium paraintracellulare]|uniref:2Fe-2S iron-sulfur cluster-binding protein n=1 Tax=Mycobacterium paraintracellulare TaxID=1138383 RepID=UPI001936D8DE|nr:2Fe-2S iron-sulfur cluster-binding protein [Mycobacterium paraintracellulare]BCP14261.1 (2Fe-2S) ferredoxin [Mycobacterium paraintracellulare]